MTEINEAKFNGRTVTVWRWPNHGTEYAALITGTHPTYKLNREFREVLERDWSRSGKHGTTKIDISSDGVYEISNPRTGCYGWQTKFFVRKKAGKIKELKKAVVMRYFRYLDKKKKGAAK